MNFSVIPTNLSSKATKIGAIMQNALHSSDKSNKNRHFMCQQNAEYGCSGGGTFLCSISIGVLAPL